MGSNMNRRTLFKLTGLLPAIAIAPQATNAVVAPAPIAAPSETATEMLARWANTLNAYEWPIDMRDKPAGFDDLPVAHRSPLRYDAEGSKAFHVGPLYNEIFALIGDKEMLRWHWLHNLDETNERFEEWYEADNEGRWALIHRDFDTRHKPRFGWKV